MGKKSRVISLADLDLRPITNLLAGYGMNLHLVPDGQDIPGSFWGDEEAGLVGNRLHARGDTPLHSVLHETCHWICMDAGRRNGLDTDAGGDYDEENAVCYLQILLSDHVPGFGRDRCMRDMDTWGYGFRLGSARAWFEKDAEDARTWLVEHGIVDSRAQPTWQVRFA